MSPEFTATIADSDLPEGTMRGIVAGGERILLAKIDNEVFAISNICSHFHTHLSNGELNVAERTVQCPLHDSCFSLRTGEPTEPPAEDPVAVYAVKIEDGMIYVGHVKTDADGAILSH